MPSTAEPLGGPERLKAEGFPVAPIIEAVMDVQFEGGISADETIQISEALKQFYPVSTEARQTQFNYDVETETLEVQEARSTFRLEGEDATELALVRPDGFSSSQLAPYKSWDLLFDRFKRDWLEAEKVVGNRKASRLAVRYINRIDVPLDENGMAQHEEYLAAHIRLPDGIPSVSDFYLRFAVPIMEIGALATVQSAVMPQAVEGKASFAIDIDIAKVSALAADREQLLVQLAEFRSFKNEIYEKTLTAKALEDFQ